MPSPVVEAEPVKVINPIKLLTDSITELKNDNNAMRGQFNSLVESLNKKFEQEDSQKQEKLTQVRSETTEPVQDERSNGLLNKKIGEVSFGEALLSLRDIANAWQSQSRLEHDATGVQNLQDFMAGIGRSVFERFVTKEGLNVEAKETIKETTASAYG